MKVSPSRVLVADIPQMQIFSLLVLYETRGVQI
jgi:hypothetical protein